MPERTLSRSVSIVLHDQASGFHCKENVVAVHRSTPREWHKLIRGGVTANSQIKH